MVPTGDARAAELFLQQVDHSAELGLQMALWRCIWGENTLHIVEIAHMAELVELVVADGLEGVIPFENGEILFRRRHRRDARARESDLGGGAEENGKVFIPLFLHSSIRLSSVSGVSLMSCTQ